LRAMLTVGEANRISMKEVLEALQKVKLMN
jgi:hypothetical protein